MAVKGKTFISSYRIMAFPVLCSNMCYEKSLTFVNDNLSFLFWSLNFTLLSEWDTICHVLNSTNLISGKPETKQNELSMCDKSLFNDGSLIESLFHIIKTFVFLFSYLISLYGDPDRCTANKYLFLTYRKYSPIKN